MWCHFGHRNRKSRIYTHPFLFSSLLGLSIHTFCKGGMGEFVWLEITVTTNYSMIGVDLLCFLMSSPPEMHTVANLFRRTTFSQSALSPEMQEVMKEVYHFQWRIMTSGPESPEARSKELYPWKPKITNNFYKNHASNGYNLINLDIDLVPIPEEGYVRNDTLSWMDRLRWKPRGSGLVWRRLRENRRKRRR